MSYDPANVPLTAWRGVAKLHEFRFVGRDLTGYTFAMQVRDAPDPLATLRVNLTHQTTAVQGVRLASVTTVDGVTSSVVAVLINAATMQGMDVAEDKQQPGTDQSVFYDLIGTPSGGLAEVLTFGSFTIKAQVTVA